MKLRSCQYFNGKSKKNVKWYRCWYKGSKWVHPEQILELTDILLKDQFKLFDSEFLKVLYYLENYLGRDYTENWKTKDLEKITSNNESIFASKKEGIELISEIETESLTYFFPFFADFDAFFFTTIFNLYRNEIVYKFNL